MFLRVIEFALRHERDASVGMCPDLWHAFAVDEGLFKGRVNGERAVNALQCLVCPPHVVERDAQARVRRRAAGVDLDEPAISNHRFFVALLPNQHRPQVLARAFIAGDRVLGRGASVPLPRPTALPH